jgi:hypothetical protein
MNNASEIAVPQDALTYQRYQYLFQTNVIDAQDRDTAAEGRPGRSIRRPKDCLTELEVPTKQASSSPGAYVQVTLKIEGNKGDLTIRAGTLLFTSGKPAVGVVRPNGTVEIRQIAINRDLGSKLEISQGLSEASNEHCPSSSGGLKHRTPPGKRCETFTLMGSADPVN